MKQITISLTKNQEEKIKRLQTEKGLKKRTDVMSYLLEQYKENFFIISRVNYRNKLYTVHILKEPLDNGNLKTNDEWAEHSKKAKQNNGFFTPDLPLLYASLSRAYDLKDNEEIEEFREKIKQLSRGLYLTTLTSTVYNPKGLDEIVHNYNQQNQQTENLNIVGPDEWIKDTETPDFYHALLQTKDDSQRINSVFNWFNNTDVYLLRLNSKPNNIERRIARFDADSDRAGLDCGRNPSVSDSSLGVRLANFP